MSDETFNSPPPSLPIPTTISFCLRPLSPVGTPRSASSRCSRKASAVSTAVSASALVAAHTSARSARPDRSRHSVRRATRCRNRPTAPSSTCRARPRCSDPASLARLLGGLRLHPSDARLIATAGFGAGSSPITCAARKARMPPRDQARPADFPISSLRSGRAAISR